MKTAKETIIEKILTDLPIASCRGEMTKEEWRGWFEEAFEKGEKYASQSKWVSCAERLPEIGQEVLCYYEIEATDSKRKKTGEIYTYKKILYIESITTRESSKEVNWIDSDYNPATPTHWQPLPDKPVE